MWRNRPSLPQEFYAHDPEVWVSRWRKAVEEPYGRSPQFQAKRPRLRYTSLGSAHVNSTCSWHLKKDNMSCWSWIRYDKVLVEGILAKLLPSFATL